MPNEIIVLASTAASLGFIHTLTGPDHYLPFIVLAKARNWSMLKTFMITFLCGLGHVLSSIILGFIGVFLGIAVFKLEGIELSRGEMAAWFLLIFGFLYFVWGVHRAFRLKPHDHEHIHEGGASHEHTHAHVTTHSHIHLSKPVNMTPWVLFIIFVFGPCEPLIPLIMYPAASHNMLAVTAVAFIFGTATISTMLVLVLASSYGLAKLPLHRMERFSHAMAGFAILMCGVAVKFLGL